MGYRDAIPRVVATMFSIGLLLAGLNPDNIAKAMHALVRTSDAIVSLLLSMFICQNIIM